MQIQSTANHSPQPARTLAYLDQTLKQGQKPEASQLDRFEGHLGLLSRHESGDNPFLYIPDRGVVKFGASQRTLQSDRRMFWATTLPKTAIFGAVGAMLNSSVGPLGMVVGGALGAAIGFESDWRKLQGQVSVRVDGEVKDSRRFYFDPSHFELKPEELHMRLIAQGILGDRIQPVSAPATRPDAVRLENWKQSGTALKTLAKERRLVADLGGQSDYGRPALHAVQALQAAELLASGEAVFVVSGHSQDRQRSLEIDGKNPEKTRVHHEKHEYVERTYEYTLSPLQDPQDLQALPEGEGLPEGMMGVYADDRKTSVIVSKRDAQQRMQFEKDGHSNQVWQSRSYLDPKADLGASGPSYGVKTLMNVTPLLTLVGACVGGIAAAGIGQQYTLMAMVGGGLVGRQAGRMVSDRL